MEAQGPLGTVLVTRGIRPPVLKSQGSSALPGGLVATRITSGGLGGSTTQECLIQ